VLSLVASAQVARATGTAEEWQLGHAMAIELKCWWAVDLFGEPSDCRGSRFAIVDADKESAVSNFQQIVRATRKTKVSSCADADKEPELAWMSGATTPGRRTF
jgi:hypothetical protein